MYGNIRSAIAFRIKTAANAMVISVDFGFKTEEIAAMALPPQIAVPEVINNDVFLLIFKILKKIKPNVKTLITEIKVRRKPSLLTETASWRFNPKPKPIIAVFSSFLEYFLENDENEFWKINP